MQKWLPNVDENSYVTRPNAKEINRGKSGKSGKSGVDPEERIKHYLSKQVEDAFTVAIYGCTASLIGADWLITAAHCITDWR